MHRGSTYNIANNLINYLNCREDEIIEFFLPGDMPYFCCSCFSCFLKGENTCPHYEKMKPIVDALDNADLIILASPSYVFDVSGQMKAFLDHLAYRWLPHRPCGKMFCKTGVAISTAAGAGTGSANKTMKRSLKFWGVSKVFSYGINVAAMNYDEIKSEKKEQINKDLKVLARKVNRAAALENKKPDLFIRFMFSLMQNSHKKDKWNETDSNYWKENGWLDGKKPWKKNQKRVYPSHR